MTMTSNTASITRSRLWLRAVFALSFVLAACGDDDAFGPPDGGGRRDSGVDSGEVLPDGGDLDGTVPDGGDAGPDVDAGPDCTGEDGCYSCEPTDEGQFLNACNELGCVPFDNRARITRLNPDGSLPPLP